MSEKRTEAKEYLRGKGRLEHKLIEIAHGRRWGSKPILVPLHMALEAVREAKKEFPSLPKGFPKASTEEWLIEALKWFERNFGE